MSPRAACKSANCGAKLMLATAASLEVIGGDGGITGTVAGGATKTSLGGPGVGVGASCAASARSAQLSGLVASSLGRRSGGGTHGVGVGLVTDADDAVDGAGVG